MLHLPKYLCKPVIATGLIVIVLIFISYLMYAKEYKFVEFASMISSMVILFNCMYSCELYLSLEKQ